MSKLKTKRVVTYLDEDYKKKLEAVCEERETNEAQVVREILKDFFESKSTSTKISSQKKV
jgi:translation initiation factor IF-3